MTEFRLRLDMIDLPIPMFGMTEIASVVAISRSPKMRRWSIGGYYDKPIPRRILEEAGFARGSFASSKRAATALIHVQGAALMAPASVASVRAFAASEGHTINLSPRRRPTRLDRGLMRLARMLRVERLAAPLAERQRKIVHHRPQTGSILFAGEWQASAPGTTLFGPSGQAKALEGAGGQLVANSEGRRRRR